MSKRMRLLMELLVNFLLPWLCYRWARPMWGEVNGLLVSSAPPVLWSLWELRSHKRVDALSMLVLAGIGLSLLALLLGGDERVLLMRESLLTGLFGTAFLLSLLLPRPLVFYLARATMERSRDDGREHCENLWRQAPFRKGIRLMSAMWGAGLLSEMALRAWLVSWWPVERCLLILPWLGYGVAAVLVSATWLMRKRMARGLLVVEAHRETVAS
ncbi:VC0807 family protein [Chromobacterium sp. IIBBL 290-4]|uniref:VC0807 family protein n=1 Tax=Chromobacterium sp. IIBBL 290-4 TaxID=2953890 RepID=UPI0020B7850C|nr:VC0807 family protein [Chromobacterium sp. IIBBL 290-4]UTH74859.1 hypothetical protein NKT35_01755 [Chromobacterium sp. IIBBL 290-4]